MPNEGQRARPIKIKKSLGPSPSNVKGALMPAKGLDRQPSKAKPFPTDGLKDGTKMVGGKRHTVQY